MKKVLFTFVGAFVLMLVGCTPAEQTARNTLAANYGLLSAAIAQYGDDCKQNPAEYACTLITRDVQAQNLAVVALEAYCGFSSASQLTDQCHPVKSLEGALTASLANVNQFADALKALIQPTLVPTPSPAPPTVNKKVS